MIDIEKQVIVGAGSIIMPDVSLKEGASIGAYTLIIKDTETWIVYVGNPARKIKNRSKDLLKLEARFLQEYFNDTI